jgi:hypothetical protein
MKFLKVGEVVISELVFEALVGQVVYFEQVNYRSE